MAKKPDNKAIATRPMRPTGLHDRKVREIAAQSVGKKVLISRQGKGPALGIASKKQATAVETVTRKSRRVTAEYNRLHVHVGADPEGKATQTPSKPDKLAQADKGHASAHVRAAQSAELRKGETGSARESFGDGRGVENVADSDNTAPSAFETLAGGGGPGVGPRFRQTERASKGGLTAALQRDREMAQLAFNDFEREYPAEAGGIAAVWNRVGREILDGDDVFKAASESYINKATRPGAGRQRRTAELAQYWRDWCAYRKDWRRAHPDAQLPKAWAVQHRHLDINSVRGAVTVILDAYRQRPPVSVAPGAPDPLVTDWEARGMPMDERDAPIGVLGTSVNMLSAPVDVWGVFRLKPLEQVLRDAGVAVQWDERPFALTRAENSARADWWNLYGQLRPRDIPDE